MAAALWVGTDFGARAHRPLQRQRQLTVAIICLAVSLSGCAQRQHGLAEPWEESAVYDIVTTTGVEGWLQIKLLDQGDYIRAEIGAFLGARGSGTNGLALAALVSKETGVVDQILSADYVFPRGAARLVPASHAFFLDNGSLDGKRGLIPIGPQWPWLADQPVWGGLEFQLGHDKVSTRQTCEYGCLETHEFTVTMEGLGDGLLPLSIVEETGSKRIEWTRAEHRTQGRIDILPKQPLPESHLPTEDCGWIPCGTEASGKFGYEDAYTALTQDPRWAAYELRNPDWQPYNFVMTDTETWLFRIVRAEEGAVDHWTVSRALGVAPPLIVGVAPTGPYPGPRDFHAISTPRVPMEGLISAVEQASGRGRGDINNIQLAFGDSTRYPSPWYSANLWVFYDDPLDIYVVSAGTGQVMQSTQRSLLAAPIADASTLEPSTLLAVMGQNVLRHIPDSGGVEA